MVKSSAPSVARRRKQSPVIAMAVLGVVGLGVLAVGAIVLPSLLKLPEEEVAAVDPSTVTIGRVIRLLDGRVVGDEVQTHRAGVGS